MIRKGEKRQLSSRNKRKIQVADSRHTNTQIRAQMSFSLFHSDSNRCINEILFIPTLPTATCTTIVINHTAHGKLSDRSTACIILIWVIPKWKARLKKKYNFWFDEWKENVQNIWMMKLWLTWFLGVIFLFFFKLNIQFNQF